MNNVMGVIMVVIVPIRLVTAMNMTVIGLECKIIRLMPYHELYHGRDESRNRL